MRSGLIPGVACLGITLAGCPQQQELDVPALLGAIVQNEASFRPNGDSPLLDITPGTPIDSLTESVVGCWGQYNDDDGQKPISISSAIRFGSDGSYESWGLQLDRWGIAPILYGASGTYEVIGPGKLMITTQHKWRQYPGSGLEDEETTPATTYAVATVDGDSMIYLEDIDDPGAIPADERVYYLYRKTDCP